MIDRVVVKKLKKPAGLFDHLKLSAKEKESQSLDDIFPDLDLRPKEIVRREKSDIETVKKYFPTLSGRIKSISDIPALIKSSQVSADEFKLLKTNFFKQLKHSNKLGLYGWRLVPYLIESRLLTQQDVKDNKKSLFNLLKSSDRDIRAESWWQIDNQLSGLLNKQEIIKHKKYLFELRRNAGWLNTGKVEVVLQSFIEKGIITEDEYMQG